MSNCLASRTQMFHVHQGEWDEQILSVLGLDRTKLAQVQPSGTLAGSLSKELVNDLGPASSTGIVTGGPYQACDALGAGPTVPGLASVSTGSAEVIELVLPSPIVSQRFHEPNNFVYGHVIPVFFLAMALIHSGGMGLRRFRDDFCEPQIYRTAQAGSDGYDLMLEGASADPTSLLVLPHFSGSGTPTFDTSSKAGIQA